MFCATFYSYKGGVGRTLALANVAVALALRGKRVLVVDFDLEAPGLVTLAEFADARQKVGILDFVQSYLNTSVVPNPKDFTYSCAIQDPTSENLDAVVVDIMPAGGRDESYAGQFASIDWGKLYSHHNGFLLMEELRASWESEQYDYVLIDSRTGHTDVGGICTRQLPNAVVAMFFPNDQNLVGLEQVVRAVRANYARPDPIDLLFVASRVPRLDDEHGHLRDMLSRFSDRLQYQSEDFLRVDQYDSLMLLNQTLFVLHRKSSGLAAQYRQIASFVSQFNPEDSVGALSFARKAARAVQGRAANRADSPATEDEETLKRLDKIGQKHEADCLIQYALARAYYRQRRLLQALIATDLAIDANGRTLTGESVRRDFMSRVYQLRLRLFREIDISGGVVESALAILNDGDASESVTLDAILSLTSTDPDALLDITSLAAVSRIEPSSLIDLAVRLSASPPAAKIAASVAQMALARSEHAVRDSGSHEIDVQLLLVAGGKFEAALTIPRPHGVLREMIPFKFNDAVALWGQSGAPDVHLFSEIVEGLSNLTLEDTANWHQCRAFACAVIGDKGGVFTSVELARTLIRQTVRREFSCWSYRTVTTGEFEAHLDAILRFGAADGPRPEVLLKNWTQDQRLPSDN